MSELLVWRIGLCRNGFRLWTVFPWVFEQAYDKCHGGDRGGEQVEAARLDAELLEAELAVVCGALNQVSARLVVLTARAIESEGWAGAGIRSVEHWLVLRAGLSPGRARQVVVMARRVGVLPVVMGQFAAGRLSVDQVAVVARHAPSQVEASVAELAVSASVPQLGRVLSRYAFDPPTGDDPDPDPAADADADADGDGDGDAVLVAGRCRWSRRWRRWVGRGSGRSCRWVPGRWPVRAAVLRAGRCRGAGRGGGVRGSRRAVRGGTPEVTWADALVQVCTRSLGSVVSRSRQESFRVYVHLDVEGGWLSGRARLPGHLVDKLTCSGTVQPVWQ